MLRTDMYGQRWSIDLRGFAPGKKYRNLPRPQSNDMKVKIENKPSMVESYLVSYILGADGLNHLFL